jgi:ABC-type Na+ transport system ATPase subunit NatA
MSIQQYQIILAVLKVDENALKERIANLQDSLSYEATLSKMDKDECKSQLADLVMSITRLRVARTKLAHWFHGSRIGNPPVAIGS